MQPIVVAMSTMASPADEFDQVVTDNVILSNEGGRWSVTLGGRSSRAAEPVPGRACRVPQESTAP
jgi:hypothetical protein